MVKLEDTVAFKIGYRTAVKEVLVKLEEFDKKIYGLYKDFQKDSTNKKHNSVWKRAMNDAMHRIAKLHDEYQKLKEELK